MTSDLAAARRILLQEASAIGVSVVVGGILFGIAARDAGLTAPDAIVMSLLPCSGAAQFAALGHLRGGGSWMVIVGVTALLNARHVLYGVSLAPSLAGLRTRERAAMAHVLTDEAFALGAAHFARVGRTDRAGYWIAALVAVYVPWNVGTAIGAIAGGVVPDLAAIGIDAVFPATMAALAVAALRATRRAPADDSSSVPACAAVPA